MRRPHSDSLAREWRERNWTKKKFGYRFTQARPRNLPLWCVESVKVTGCQKFRTLCGCCAVSASSKFAVARPSLLSGPPRIFLTRGIEGGADVGSEDNKVRTGFQLASAEGYDEVARLLSEHDTK
jgi:hypothetical protein